MIRPEKIVLHLSFPHPVYGTFTPVKMEEHYFVETEEDKDQARDMAKKSMEEWFRKNYPNPDEYGIANPPRGEVSYTKESIVPPVIDLNQERMEIAIDNCKTVEELKEWKSKHDILPGKILAYCNKKIEELTK